MFSNLSDGLLQLLSVGGFLREECNKKSLDLENTVSC